MKLSPGGIVNRSSSSEELYGAIIRAVERQIDERNNPIIKKDEGVEEAPNTNEDQVDRSELKEDDIESDTRVSEEMVYNLISKGDEQDKEIKRIVAEVFFEKDNLSFSQFNIYLNLLSNDSCAIATGFKINIAEFIKFLRSSFEMMKPSKKPFENFKLLLGNGISSEFFNRIAQKTYRLIFFQQIPERISFAEYSLTLNYIKNNHIGDEYLKKTQHKLSQAFILEILKSFSSRKKYQIPSGFASSFSTKLESIINALNGLVVEKLVDCSVIPKIIYTLIIFNLENKKSVFKQTFGDEELFYCSVRAHLQGKEAAKKIEHYIKIRLLWTFQAEKLNTRLDTLYQTVYKYEYDKILGCILPVKTASSRYSSRFAESSSAYMEEGHFLTTQILQTTPKPNKKRSVHAFSPLSRRIGEATGHKESFDSKRQLKFE